MVPVSTPPAVIVPAPVPLVTDQVPPVVASVNAEVATFKQAGLVPPAIAAGVLGEVVIAKVEGVNDAVVAVPPAVVTAICPLVPLPITATICDVVFVVIDATAVPPIVTAVALSRFVPFMVNDEPVQPVELNEVIAGAGGGVIVIT